MTRRVRRHKAFEILVHVKDEAFLRPPREAQRNWLLNRLVKETADDLVALDEAARGFVRGGEPVVMSDRDQARLADEEIMEDWQIPVMKAMAEAITDTHGDILEIGFGRGVASSLIQEQQVRSHTIIVFSFMVSSVSFRYGRRRSAGAMIIRPATVLSCR
jgi:guanidinoacetate N-methyltransferase